MKLIKKSLLLLLFISALPALNSHPAYDDSGMSSNHPGYSGAPPPPCSACNHSMNMGGLMSMHSNLTAYWLDVKGAPFKSEGVIRNYYIRADEVVWDYAPKGYNGITGKAWNDDEKIWTKRQAPYLGSKYIKCIYREYTDETFTKLKKRSKNEEYMGTTGPTIRAEVGDTIIIKFKNDCDFPTTMHPHGVFYNKDSEGAPYSDGSKGKDKKDDGVPPGYEHTYTWYVPERAGPASMDGSTAMWMYHSHANEATDIQAGLMGFMVITAKGLANPDATPIDVDQELFFNFQIFDESQSPCFNRNLKRYGKAPYPDPTDAKFKKSNTKYAINGYIFGNNPMPKIKKDSRVRWNIMSMELHTPHWHGNTFVTDGMRMDIIGLLHAEMKVVDMVPDNVGIWLYHCHVPDHFHNGMVTRYEVVE